MAYNPFNIFRRNQKSIFAVVTVIIMFVFVLSTGLSGGNDFFDWLPRWLGAKTSKGGDVLCKLDGDKITDRDLYDLQQKRLLANRFMLMATSEVTGAVRQYVNQQLNSITDPNARNAFSNAHFAAMFPFQRMQMGNPMEQAARLAQAPNATAAEKDVYRALVYEEILSQQMMFSQGGDYFLNLPNRSKADMLAFLIWQKKADQLGIQFNTKDIYKLIQDEFYGYFNPQAEVTVRQEMQRQLNNTFNLEKCVEAIGEEFRVRTAQLALLGPGIVYLRPNLPFSGSPVFPTPYEQYQYYREQCSPTDYELLPVPAAAFLDKVPGPSDERELGRLFDQYKNAEPNPARETPGFKKPREVKLSWVSATGEEPHYQKLAEEGLKAGEVQAKVGLMMTVPLPGVSPALLAQASVPLTSKDLLLEVDSVRTEYTTTVKERHGRLVQFGWSMPSFVTELTDTSVVRPTTLAAALGGSVGGTLSLSGPLIGVQTFGTAVRSFELRDRVFAGAPAVLGAVPGPSLFATVIGSVATSDSLLPKPLPLAVFRPELIKHLQESTAKQLLLADLKTFSTEVAKMAKPEANQPKGTDGLVKDKGPLLQYIKDFAAKRGWKEGASQRLDSEWNMDEDPGLAPMLAAYDKWRSTAAASAHGMLPAQFGKKFFWNEDPRRPGEQRTPATGLYAPVDFPEAPSSFESPAAKPEPRFLAWRTEDVPPKVQEFSNPAVKNQVLLAWKRTQARTLAKNKAEALAAAVRTSAGDTPELITQNMRELANTLQNEIANPKAKESVRLFEIKDVCPLTGGFQLRPFRLTATADMPYPTPAMEKTLIDERTKAPKTTFVLPDGPQDIYYVVTVKAKQDKTEQNFSMIYEDFSAGGQFNQFNQSRQMVLGTYFEETKRAAIESVMGLLKKEFRFEMSDEQKKKLEELDKSGNSGGGDF
jgi:hypothetical protein